MKLYTEEQLRKALYTLHYSVKEMSEDEIVDLLTPIKLPSDEEIEEESLCCAWGSLPFELGAEWLIEQIKQQADGN